MKNVIIFGTKQFAEILYEYLSLEPGIEVCAFTIDRDYITESSYLGLPVVPFEDVQNIYPPSEYSIFIALGYTNMNKVRQLKFEQAKQKGYRIESFCHKSATILSKNFGEGNIVFECVTIGSSCTIGNGNIFWPRAHIAHHTTVGNFNFFTISVAVAGNISIHNNCVFGNNCTIRNHIDIADFTLVGAGTYVDKSTESHGVYVPARSIKLENKTSMDMHL